MSGCPNESDLRRYHAGELESGDAARIRSHLHSCENCKERDASLIAEHEAFVQQLRGLTVSDIKQNATAGSTSGVVATITRAEETTAAPKLTIEGYEVLQEIHRGGQGVVYKALQKSMKRKVAIKVLLDGAYSSVAARRRFEREIELVASLRHPNIIGVHDSGMTNDNRPYCVMDYIEGQPLDKYLRRTQLPLEDTLGIFGKICDAVAYAHQRGVIHRDLKPSNILVDREGSPKVLDFGLAKNLAGPVDHVLSMTGQVVGTLPYMAPEQAEGYTSDVDTRTDVYALGVILFELLTGHYPYPVVGQMADVLKHIVETPAATPSSQWSPDTGISGSRSKRHRSGKCPIDDEIQTIVLRCLAKERERRYESAGGLLRDIDRYASGDPIEAKRDSAWYVLRKLICRHSLESAAIGAVLVIVVSFGFISFGLYRQARNALEARDASNSAVLQKSAEADAAVKGALRPAVRQMAFGWFLAAWRVNHLERAREILDQTPPESPEHAGMVFLLDETYTADRFLDALSPDSRSFAYLLIGERELRVGRTAAAIEAFEECVSTPGGEWLRSTARAALRKLRDQRASSPASGVNP